MGADAKLKALGQVPLFAHCSRKELEFIAREGDEVEMPAGKTLTREGRPGDTFYVLLEGEAEVKIGGKTRRVLKTRTDARLFVMSHAQFRDAIKSSDALMVKVLRAMGERLRADLAGAGR
jgi:CRP-like cAMP-binding protein